MTAAAIRTITRAVPIPASSSESVVVGNTTNGMSLESGRTAHLLKYGDCGINPCYVNDVPCVLFRDYASDTTDGQNIRIRRLEDGDALTVAAENFQQLGAAVTLRKADALGGLEEAFPERFDMIVSNPPYVPESDRAAMHPNVRDHEPGLALFVPDDDAIRFYRAIARAGRQMLTPGGRLWFEIYERAAAEIVRMLGAEGYTDTEVREDLFGKPRMVCTRLK